MPDTNVDGKTDDSLNTKVELDYGQQAEKTKVIQNHRFLDNMGGITGNNFVDSQRSDYKDDSDSVHGRAKDVLKLKKVHIAGCLPDCDAVVNDWSNQTIKLDALLNMYLPDAGYHVLHSSIFSECLIELKVLTTHFSFKPQLSENKRI